MDQQSNKKMIARNNSCNNSTGTDASTDSSTLVYSVPRLNSSDSNSSHNSRPNDERGDDDDGKSMKSNANKSTTATSTKNDNCPTIQKVDVSTGFQRGNKSSSQQRHTSSSSSTSTHSGEASKVVESQKCNNDDNLNRSQSSITGIKNNSTRRHRSGSISDEIPRGSISQRHLDNLHSSQTSNNNSTWRYRSESISDEIPRTSTHRHLDHLPLFQQQQLEELSRSRSLLFPDESNNNKNDENSTKDPPQRRLNVVDVLIAADDDRSDGGNSFVDFMSQYVVASKKTANEKSSTSKRLIDLDSVMDEQLQQQQPEQEVAEKEGGKDIESIPPVTDRTTLLTEQAQPDAGLSSPYATKESKLSVTPSAPRSVQLAMSRTWHSKPRIGKSADDILISLESVQSTIVAEGTNEDDDEEQQKKRNNIRMNEKSSRRATAGILKKNIEIEGEMNERRTDVEQPICNEISVAVSTTATRSRTNNVQTAPPSRLFLRQDDSDEERQRKILYQTGLCFIICAIIIFLFVHVL